MDELDELRLKIARLKGAVLYQAHDSFILAKPGWETVYKSAWHEIPWPEQMPERWDHRTGYASEYKDYPRDWLAAGELIEEIAVTGRETMLDIGPNGANFYIQPDWSYGEFLGAEFSGAGEKGPEAVSRAYHEWRKAIG